ncbi:MMPL family transporter [Actinoplanes teichomyceticus]|uniref:RND superfamily putative drug exporter n=1 Tax=Actinoplanes teichomyceticus TaxID=1867 RepID=A0A561WAZ1_ACTTI|nr:MMPL family transporter [Actinoplanes teichomyceticus]TWG21021.1 RND superfamily putative drug exporter [Actinoplanes teichomyceticus]GIF14841.1 membrane protein [Actinoplanes teichomyceticus]
MATLLYRLGRFSFRRRRAVALAWLTLLVAAIAGMAALQRPYSSTLTIPGIPAMQTTDLLAQRFPQAAGQTPASTASARLVFAAPDGQTLTSAGSRTAVRKMIAALSAAPQIASVTDPYRSQTLNPDATVGYTQAAWTVAAPDLSQAARDGVDSAVRTARDAGLTVEISGSIAPQEEHVPLGEIIGLLVAAIVLLMTLGSLIAAGLPLLTAFAGVGTGVAGIGIATHFGDLSATTSTLATMLGLAVAIDYALFIVSRYRSELAAGHDRPEAAGRAAGTAGNAVVFAGLTVIIALAGLTVVDIPFLTEMGLAAAGTVAVAVVIALTLLPAMLGFAGHRIRPGKTRTHTAGTTLSSRWIGAIVRRPVIAVLAGAIGLGVIAIPAFDLRLGLPTEGGASPDSTQRKAYDLLADGFGPGFNGPLTVVVDGPAAKPAVRLIQAIDDVAVVTPPVVNHAGDTAVLTVIPRSAPDAPATETLVHTVRDLDGILGVTGTTALNLDVSEKLADALLPYLILIVGLAFVLLVLVFRSLLVPLKATLGFLLSVAATFGALVAVFQWGWLTDLFAVDQTGPIISFLPILLIGIVFGLAMDYQVFLVTRMREDFVHGAAPTDAVISGFTHGARIVTAAALIMMSVFFGFMLAPEAITKSIGFGLGIAIVFDAIVVRMILVPAVMTLLGRSAWWLPRRLDRVLPDVDIEGEKLKRHLAPEPAPAGDHLIPG